MGTMISDSKKFIFIHVPKTAGLSMASQLDPYRRHASIDRKPLRSAINLLGVYTGLRMEKWFRGRVIPEHAGLCDLVRLVPDLDLNVYFKFAVVRNPWDRVASSYSYHQNHSKSRYLRPGYWETRGMDFTGWLEAHAKRRRDGRIKSQYELVVDPRSGELALDQLLRFERLKEDFAVLVEKLQLATGTLPALNRSSRTDYRSMFDNRRRRLVEEIYADDISAFGYTF